MHEREALIGNKPMTWKGPKIFWYFVLASFLLWLLLLFSYYSGLKDNSYEIAVHTQKSNSVFVQEKNPIGETINMTESNPIDNFFIGGDWDKFVNEIEKKELKSHLTENEAQSINNVFGKGNEGEEFVNGDEEEQKIEIESSSDSDSEPCLGKYIYIHDLPTEFNEDLLKHCKSLSDWYNMCHYMSNFGLGPRINNPDKILSNTGWFETNQFMLEVIFHNRMKQYKCLTNDSSLASAIFVPYYAGLDVARYLWNSNRLRRDFYSVRLVKWLKEKPEWKKLWGRDHFLVAGRITWDFRRLTNGNSDWGNRLMLLPESRNMTILTIESSPWSKNDFAIPYPTYFHPSSDGQIFQWQNRMRRMKRRILFSFVGAPRPNLINSIRNNIIQQCQAARKKCKMLDCASGSNKCYKPTYVMKIFQTSIFCLQPAGDSYTRRSTFDSILAGCIPVFFHPGSAYVQYLWHLPKDYTKYSVFIPGNDVRNGKANIERILSRISKAKILAMREQVLKLIPGVVYADPRSSLKILEDAFDITVDGVLERVEKIREEVEQGNEVSDDGEEFTWKKNLFGTVEKHEWDHFFDRS